LLIPQPSRGALIVVEGCTRRLQPLKRWTVTYLGFPAPGGKPSFGAPTQPVHARIYAKNEVGIKGCRKLTRALQSPAYCRFLTRLKTRAVSAALHTPQLGGGTLSQGGKNSVPSRLRFPEKASIPKLKYEALEISEVTGHFERNVLMRYSFFGPL